MWRPYDTINGAYFHVVHSKWRQIILLLWSVRDAWLHAEKIQENIVAFWANAPTSDENVKQNKRFAFLYLDLLAFHIVRLRALTKRTDTNDPIAIGLYFVVVAFAATEFTTMRSKLFICLPYVFGESKSHAKNKMKRNWHDDANRFGYIAVTVLLLHLSFASWLRLRPT